MTGPTELWAVGGGLRDRRAHPDGAGGGRSGGRAGDRPVAGLWRPRTHSTDRRARFAVADARRLPVADGRMDVVVSGLVLNFVPDPGQAAREMARVARPGGRVAVYLWDYADRMELIRYFWDAAAIAGT